MTMKGYNGCILRIELTSGKSIIEKPPEDFYKRYLGGRGFIIYFLLHELAAGIDALGPENKLVFALGPVTGHPLPGSGRNSVGSKSPLTGAFGEAEVGGFWGAELRRSGYDAVIMEGMASHPVYVWIDQGRVEIRDARHLWGKEVAETEQTIRGELNDNRIRTAIIGPAGEKMVRYACIFNDVAHAAGRTGLGAVMGAKKVKAIAVRGKTAPEVADRDELVALTQWMSKNFKDLVPWWKYGTGSGVTMKTFEATGNLPICNFQGGRFPSVEKTSAQTMYEKGYMEKMGSCFVCPIRCKKRLKPVAAADGSLIPAGPGPEYETLAAFGANCGIDNLEAIIEANALCSRHGIDTISAGVTIAFAMECFEKGLIDLKDTDGVPLTFGNAEALVAMVEKICLRQGFGDILAEGTLRAAQKIGKGSEAFAMHVKGEEIPMHEPRYKKGMGLHYGVHATGADHCTGIHDDVDIKNLARWELIDVADPVPASDLSPRKARMLYQLGMWRHVGNYLGLCQFVPWSYTQIRDMLTAITGWPMSLLRLVKAAERGITLARIFNLREGFSAKDDQLPGRFEAAPPDGPLQGESVNPTHFASSRKAYYQMLGWNAAGVPRYGKLVELEIEWAHEYFDEVP